MFKLAFTVLRMQEQQANLQLLTDPICTGVILREENSTKYQLIKYATKILSGKLHLFEFLSIQSRIKRIK